MSIYNVKKISSILIECYQLIIINQLFKIDMLCILNKRSKIKHIIPQTKNIFLNEDAALLVHFIIERQNYLLF